MLVAHKQRPDEDHWTPLTWRPAISDGVEGAMLFCANGHATGFLPGGNHHIEMRGIVIPSVICMHPGCTFHEIIRLEGWA